MGVAGSGGGVPPLASAQMVMMGMGAAGREGGSVFVGYVCVLPHLHLA